jgi:hypothetical protein
VRPKYIRSVLPLGACCLYSPSYLDKLSEKSFDHFDESGKMVEEWASYDLLGAMRQMGAIP